MLKHLSVWVLNLLHIYFTTVWSHWVFSHGKFRLPSLRKAGCHSHAAQPMVHAGCFVVSIIHWTLTWTTGSFNMCTDVNAFGCTEGYMDTVRVCTESWLWEKSLAALGNRTCLSGVPVQRSTNWATSPPQVVMVCLNLRVTKIWWQMVISQLAHSDNTGYSFKSYSSDLFLLSEVLLAELDWLCYSYMSEREKHSKRLGAIALLPDLTSEGGAFSAPGDLLIVWTISFPSASFLAPNRQR